MQKAIGFSSALAFLFILFFISGFAYAVSVRDVYLSTLNYYTHSSPITFHYYLQAWGAETVDCRLYIDNVQVNSSLNVDTSGADVTIQGVATATNHTWYVGCNSTGGTGTSDIRKFTTPNNAIYCSSFSEANTVYTLTSDLQMGVPYSGTYCLTITAPNVTVACGGHIINSTDNVGYRGIYSNQLNSTVKDCVISNFRDGVQFVGSNQSNVSNISFSSIGSSSLWLTDVHNSSFSNNSLYSATVDFASALYLGSNSTNNTFTGNKLYCIDDSVICISLVDGSYNNKFINNQNSLAYGTTAGYSYTQQKFSATADSAQNETSYGNTGWWPLLTSLGSDATDQAHTAWFNGSSGGRNADNTTNANNWYWYNNQTRMNISNQTVFTNASAGQGNWFLASAGAQDLDGASDVVSTSITATAGICSYSSNSSSTVYFNVTYNCTSGAYSSSTVVIKFTNSLFGSVQTNPATNYFPNFPNSAPNLTLISPNYSIYNASNVSLNYTVTSASPTGISKCWYNIDGGSNTTLAACANSSFIAATSGAHIVRLYANDSVNNISFDYTNFAVDLGNISSQANATNYTVPENKTTVLIPSDYSTSAVDMGNSTNESTNASIIVSITAASITQSNATLNASINISRNLSASDIIISLPANLTIAGPASWAGTIDIPTAQNISDYSVNQTIVNSTISISQVIAVGFGANTLNLDKAVQIIFDGQGGKLAGYSQGAGNLIPITTVCAADTQTAGDALAAGGNCKYDYGTGGNLVIWTKHMTSFAIYSESAPSPPVPPPNPGESGGGSISQGLYGGLLNITENNTLPQLPNISITAPPNITPNQTNETVVVPPPPPPPQNISNITAPKPIPPAPAEQLPPPKQSDNFWLYLLILLILLLIAYLAWRYSKRFDK